MSGQEKLPVSRFADGSTISGSANIIAVSDAASWCVVRSPRRRRAFASSSSSRSVLRVEGSRPTTG
jgi:hypothetical protein